jgi:hypothetical protein
LTHNAIQNLLLKRFILATGTYVLALLLLWLAILSGHFQGSVRSALVATALVMLSQSLLFAIFFSGRNLRFPDPSLTEVQVLLGIGWQTWLIAHLDAARGAFLIFYVLILMFGLFHLPRRAFVRCAALVFFSFACLNLWEGYHFELADPTLAALQVCVLFIVLVWLALYASYVQASRLRMRQRRFALQAHQDTLRGMMRQLEDLVATDELTGLFNRRHFLQADDPDGFAAAVTSLLRDSARRRAIGGAGRRLVEERYSWSKVVDEFENHCGEVIRHAS